MTKISILPEILTNKIAAGEVIERPATVVKELIENAIDAKARSISISLADGGTRRIQVQDDGEGMCREDAQLAFERHATSKIVNEADLAAIATFGFRGEALPSIASVANVRLVTRTADHDEGSEIILEGGARKEARGIGAPIGSLFDVRDLFYNVPARKKFLKSAGTELSHIRQVVLHQALAHPEIHFQLAHQDKTLLVAPAVSNFRDRFEALYGGEALGHCVEARRLLPDLQVYGFVSKIPLQRGALKDQVLFVNHRFVKSPIVSRAVYDAYGTGLMRGDHPFYLLYLDMNAATVDVNVHPTKREVRFHNADLIYRAVRTAVQEVLIRPAEGRRGDALDARYHPDRSNTLGLSTVPSPPPSSDLDLSSKETPSGVGGTASAGSPVNAVPSVGNYARPAAPSTRGLPRTAEAAGHSDLSGSTGVANRHPLLSEPLIRPMGQVYGTFLLAEVDGELVMVDQHTAHERILYEAFLKRDSGQTGAAIQPLLIPRQVELTHTQAAVMMEQIDLLRQAGFMIEPFGETLFLIRSVPMALSDMDLEAFLVDFSEDSGEPLEKGGREDRRHKIIASMACHSAVRANQILNLDQIQALLHDYFSRNTPPTCPHGRPIIIKYPLPELEKQFRRK